MIRRLSTTATATTKKTNWLLWIGVPSSAIVAGSLYAYSTASNSKVPVAKPSTYKPSLDGNWKSFKVEKVVSLNHNVKQFTFSLPEGTTELGLPTAGFVLTKYQPKDSDKPIIRPYTPVMPDDEGAKTFDMVVKIYEQGKMSKHIGSLKPGDELEINGPNLKYAYEANKEGHVGLVAGGSGLTPMLQIVQQIANNQADKTKVDLIFANVEEKDIFLKDKLDEYAAKKPDQIKIHYVLEKPPKEWKGPSGNRGLYRLAHPILCNNYRIRQ
jgi:cytochrome-b5 reductase